MRRLVALAIPLGLAGPALAQTPPAETPPVDPVAPVEPPEMERPPEEVPPPPPPPPRPPQTVAPTPVFGADLPPLDLVAVDADTLAIGSTLEMAAASFSLASTGRASDDTDNEETTIGLAFGARWFGSLEKTRFGYSVDASLRESLSRLPFMDGHRTDNSLGGAVVPEARYYVTPDRPYFVFGNGAVSFDVRSSFYSGLDAALGFEDDSVMPGSTEIAVGFGAGRVLGIDPIVRLRRLEEALAARGVLNGAITPEVGSELIRTWYALRNDLSGYRRLAYTVKGLNDAGLVSGDLDLQSTYEALAVLQDPYLVNRRVGWDARLGFGVIQRFIGLDEGGALDPDTEPDATLAIIATGQHERPLATDRQLSLRAKAVFELGDPGDYADPATEPTPRAWMLRGFVDFTKVFYTEHFDPTGAVTVAGEGGISGVRSPDNEDLFGGAPTATGVDVAATVAYSRALNRASLGTLAGVVRARNDGVFTFMLDLGITWGVATGYYTPYVVPAGW